MGEQERRRFSDRGRVSLSLAWQNCLSKKPKPPQPIPYWKRGKEGDNPQKELPRDACEIHDVLVEEVLRQLEEAGLPSPTVRDQYRLTFEIGAYCISPNFGQPEGLEKCQLAAETRILNGWLFSEVPSNRKLSKEDREQITGLIEEKGRRRSMEEITAILAQAITSQYFVESAEDDEEILEIFNSLVSQFEDPEREMGIELFLDEFERKVLCHPKLKESKPRPDKAPEQQELF